MNNAITGALYDKKGVAYSLDHEHNGTAYVRPLVKTIIHAPNYHGDDFSEEEDFEPADYLVAMCRAELFDAPPVAAINEDVVAKRAELDALKSEAAKATRDINSDRLAAEQALRSAQRQLDEWMKKHRVMTDLGKLLEKLPDRQRLPIVHMKLEGLSVAEAARATGMSEAAVKVGVHRGLKALAELIRSGHENG
jgi:RNA polymerase sigma-70 factor (ECF subfamily)